MNRTRLAQLTAVLGAAVLLVLAVAVTRTSTDRTRIAGPALDQIATQAPGQTGPASEDAQEQGSAGDTPVMGPTATEPAATAEPAAPGADGSGTEPFAPGNADTPLAPPGTDTTAEPDTGPTAEPGPLPRERDAVAPGTASTSPPADDDPESEPAGTTDPSGEATTPPSAPTGTAAPEDASATAPGADDPPAGPGSEGATTSGPAPPPPPPPNPKPEVETPPDRVYQVVPGDNLWDIVEAALGARASNAEIAVAVQELYELNRHVIGDDPDLIFPGQVFELPTW